MDESSTTPPPPVPDLDAAISTPSLQKQLASLSYGVTHHRIPNKKPYIYKSANGDVPLPPKTLKWPAPMVRVGQGAQYFDLFNSIFDRVNAVTAHTYCLRVQNVK